MSDSVPSPLVLSLPTEQDTEALAAQLAKLIVPGMVVYLSGELGAGKTALVRALLRSLNVAGPIKSPTYTLVEPYVISNIYFYHFDFYRFVDPEEWLEAGFDEYFNRHAVVFIEWPERAGDLLPAPDLHIRLELAQAPASGHEGGRILTMQANSILGQSCLKALQP